MPKKTNGNRSRKARAAKSTNTTSANPGRPYELLGLVCVAAGLISLGGLFGLNVGFVGLYFAKFLHYFFGVGAVLVCVLILGCLAAGYSLTTGKKSLKLWLLVAMGSLSLLCLV